MVLDGDGGDPERERGRQGVLPRPQSRERPQELPRRQALQAAQALAGLTRRAAHGEYYDDRETARSRGSASAALHGRAARVRSHHAIEANARLFPRLSRGRRGACRGDEPGRARGIGPAAPHAQEPTCIESAEATTRRSAAWRRWHRAGPCTPVLPVARTHLRAGGTPATTSGELRARASSPPAFRCGDVVHNSLLLSPDAGRGWILDSGLRMRSAARSCPAGVGNTEVQVADGIAHLQPLRPTPARRTS